MTTLRKACQLLTPAQRRHAVGLFAVMLFVSLLQLGAVASIMPFMAVVADPGIVERNEALAWLHDLAGLERQGFLILLGCLVLAAVIVSNAAAALGLWVSDRFTWSVTTNLSKDLLKKYLSRSYLWFVRHGSADAGKNILSEVESFASGFLHSFLHFLTKGMTVIGLLAVIVIVDWKAALVASLFIGGSYAIVYAGLRRWLMSIGETYYEINHQRYKAVQEAFGAFQETRVFQRESFFVRAYEEPTRRLSRVFVFFGLARALPRHLLEIFAFGGLLALVLYFLSTTDDFRHIIPVLSLYAFAGYKLMPALQQCFSSVASLRFNQYLVGELHRNFFAPEFEETVPVEFEKRQPVRKLPLSDAIRFEDVTFTYPGSAGRPAVRGVNLAIPTRTMTAFCGSTGSGKTTLVNLLLGLLPPTGGRIRIDDTVLDSGSLPGWRRNLGYVPQHIFLMDDTIARNLAFGLPDEGIDEAAMIRAAKAAQVHEFITSELPEGYGTIIGERGVRLSGGERQRLGIARALYHDPEVLIFDEATSALDSATESRVMEAIQNAAREKTVILIAHRLSTVRECDRIFVVERGRVVEEGRYGELIDSNGTFSVMANGAAR